MAKVIILSMEDYISAREAAYKYFYCLKTIRRWANARKVKAFRHGRKWYICKPSLKAWLHRP